MAIVLALVGVFSVGLGIWHIWVPRTFAFERAIGTDGNGAFDLGSIALGPWRYRRRRRDAVGLTWVMSNAASYVLVSIGVLDIAWALGSRTIPVDVGGWWVAGWWLIRALGQFAVGRRIADVGIALWFGALAVVHVAIAVSG